MYIPIPTGNKHTATYTARVVKHVCCEHCSCKFVYLLQRSASASASSPLWLNEEGASQKAKGLAVLSVKEQLEGAFEPVPCPDCGKFQRIISQYLRRWLMVRYAGTAIIVVLVARLVIAFLVTNHKIAPPSDETMNLFWAAATAVTLAAAIVAWIHDPNRDSDQRIQREPTADSTVLRLADYEKLSGANVDPAASATPSVPRPLG